MSQPYDLKKHECYVKDCVEKHQYYGFCEDGDQANTCTHLKYWRHPLENIMHEAMRGKA